MKLYHGTNGDRIKSILRSGLLPRGRTGNRDNWRHNGAASNPHCIYMTDSYAPYFAFNASRGKTPTCAVIEIDIDQLDDNQLTYDEDCWEQLGRRSGGLVDSLQNRAYRQQMTNDEMKRNFSDSAGTTGWQLSLKALGTCAHLGIVPAAAITRAITFPYTNKNLMLRFVWDPTITLVNQRLCGDTYRALTARLFGDPFVADHRVNFSLDNATIWTRDQTGAWQTTPYQIARDAALDAERLRLFEAMSSVSIVSEPNIEKII